MPSIGPLEIAVVVLVIFLIFGPRGIKRLAGRSTKRLKDTGTAALEAGKGAKESFAAPPTGEGPAAEAGRAVRTAGEAAADAGRGVKAGLTGEADEAPASSVGVAAQKAAERVRAGGEAVVESGREFRGALDQEDADGTADAGALPRSDG